MESEIKQAEYASRESVRRLRIEGGYGDWIGSGDMQQIESVERAIADPDSEISEVEKVAFRTAMFIGMALCDWLSAYDEATAVSAYLKKSA